MRNKLRASTIILSLALVGVLLIPAVSPGLALQQEVAGDSLQRTVSVSGCGQVDAQPNLATLTLGVQTEAKEAAQALTENSQQMQTLVDVLKEVDIDPDDIQTQTVRLYPRYEEPPSGRDERELTGYTATNLVQVRVRNLSLVGSLLDTAVQAGGNRIEGIRFEVSDPSGYMDRARDAAWKDAQHKAEQLARLAGAQLGEVLTINETGRAPQPVMERAVAVEAAAAVPIEPGSQTIEVDLQVTWLLRGEE